jgi:hypothetical protein
MRRRADPLIMKAVSAATPKRGLTAATAAGRDDPAFPAADGRPVLAGDGPVSAGVHGMGAPGVFSPATTAPRMEQGSLVRHSIAGEAVWRGLGEAKIKMDMPQNKREAPQRSVQKILTSIRRSRVTFSPDLIGLAGGIVTGCSSASTRRH